MQQINLYPPELRPSEEWLTTRSLSLVCLGLMTLFIISFFSLSAHQRKIEKNIAEMESQYVQATERVNKVKSAPYKSNAKAIDSHLAQLREKIIWRQNLGEIIGDQNLGNQRGFSKPLTVLAEYSLPTISLQRIRLASDTDIVELSGLSKRPADIPRYLHSLSQTPAFESFRFGDMSISETSTQSIHRFSIGFESVYRLAEAEN